MRLTVFLSVTAVIAVLAGCGSSDQPSVNQQAMTKAPTQPSAADQKMSRGQALKQGGIQMGMNPNMKNVPVLGSGIKGGN